ncbi:hypothetical protein C0991_009793 [Blastosporella zonata]|nr:hypothetical protein C0991_009793 [Blastosporella zonata]
MSVAKVPNAVETNHKLFGPYARKLASDDIVEYTAFADKLAKWLADGRAYYPAARPQILKLLKIALATLQRNAWVDRDSYFHISKCVNHPMISPYSNLLNSVKDHKERFVEPEMFGL